MGTLNKWTEYVIDVKTTRATNSPRAHFASEWLSYQQHRLEAQSGAWLEKIDFILAAPEGMLIDEVELVKDHNSKSKQTRLSTIFCLVTK